MGVSFMLGYNRSGYSHLDCLTPFRSKNGAGGFSLIETLVVISILALTAIVTIPNMIAWRSGMQFRAAVNELRNDLESAKTQAVKENAKVTVAFDPTAGQYRMTYPDQDNKIILLKSQTFPAGVRIASENAAHTLDSLGNQTSFSSRGTAQACTIVLANQQAKTKWIVINFIGKIEVKDG
jgi:prepilin-type N-terminal cleavage/methylation domain-containing protein